MSIRGFAERYASYLLREHAHPIMVHGHPCTEVPLEELEAFETATRNTTLRCEETAYRTYYMFVAPDGGIRGIKAQGLRAQHYYLPSTGRL